MIQIYKWLGQLFESRLWALVRKEINQILKNKQLLFLLIFPPTVQLLLYGFALNPDVQNLPLGVVDYANTATSRELVAAFTENQVFIADHFSLNEQILSQQVRNGAITAGIVIPPEFSRDLSRDQPAEIQVLVDAVDANTAGIASGYIRQIVHYFNQQLAANPQPPQVDPQVIFLYNPGLTSSWFFVPGMIGVVLTLTSTLVSSVTVVREKDTGTLEQLLMTPAADWEILLAKVAPLFVLLMGDVILGLTVAHVVFSVPFRGNFPLFMALSGLYVIVGIGFGIMLATLSRSQQQAVLTSFFVNLPLIQLSGAIAPIESMPILFQYLSEINPLRHYIAIIRGLMLKGVGLDVLWPDVLALAAFAVVLLSVSINKFRTQLS
jgi:ABC-2 type transport system permease protein